MDIKIIKELQILAVTVEDCVTRGPLAHRARPAADAIASLIAILDRAEHIESLNATPGTELMLKAIAMGLGDTLLTSRTIHDVTITMLGATFRLGISATQRKAVLKAILEAGEEE